MIKLYNTLTREIEEVKPLSDNHVTLYTCGLTVYSQPHIGNWVAYIYWDILQRVLEADGYTVKRVENYTDVGHLVSDDDSGEDKMEKGAKAEGITAWDVAEKYISVAEHEASLLNLKKPLHVRATSCIDKQIDFIGELEDKGYTYIIENEGVYFDTSKLNDYGKLAKLDIEGLEAGARVAVDGKKNATDFALWKFSPRDAKRDMEWESPWGVGFPGWHLECSVIAKENLGEHIDIHTGGIDHIPVHHTNEIAQSESLYGVNFANYWVHANHIKVNGTKMSKSLGNIYTLQDIIDKGYSVMAFKLLILSKHYRTEGNFTWEIIEASQNRLQNWQSIIDRSWQLSPSQDDSVINDIKQALSVDLDTPKALMLIDEYLNGVEYQGVAVANGVEEALNDMLGIEFIHEDITSEQKAILDKRSQARDAKDWDKSDKLRDELHKQGIGVNDSSVGQIWHRLGN